MRIPHRILIILVLVIDFLYNIPIMNSNTAYGTAIRRRVRRTKNKHVKYDEMSPFQKWMLLCLLPVYLQFEANEKFTRDMPRYYAAQFDAGTLFLCAAEAAVFGASGLVLWGIGKCLAKVIRKMQRPKYYPQERMRRRRLAKERRSIRKRFTLNQIPTAEMLLNQWERVRNTPEDMITFGSMLCDLEAYVDNSLIRDEYGEIIGRNPGIRGWLADNCPQLFLKYKTVMKYKTMAEKFRQAIGLSDPYPATMVIGDYENTVRNSQIVMNEKCENTVRNSCAGRGNKGEMEWIQAARKAAKVFFEEIGKSEKVRRENKGIQGKKKKSGVTQKCVVAVLDGRLKPDLIPVEIEIMERKRQGLPERDGILRKFTEMMA